MKKSLLTLAAFAAVLCVNTANAGTKVGQWTAGAGGIWTNTDNQRGVDDAAGFSVSGGYAMSENWDVSLNIFAGNHDRTGTVGKTTVKGVTFDFDRVFNRDARISPFLTFGAGIIDQFRAGLGNADKEVVAKFGGGALADITEFGAGNKLQVKVSAAARTSIGRHITDIVGGLGLQMTFGAGGK